MEMGQKIVIKKWLGLPNDDHTWAFYYYLKRQDDIEVKKRVIEENDKVDIVTRESQVYE